MTRTAAAALAALAWLAAPAAPAQDAGGKAPPPAPAAALSKEETARLQRWIDDLDNAGAARREEATAALRAFGPRGLPLLRAVLDAGSAEQRARVSLLVTVLEAGGARTTEDDVGWGTLKGDMGRTAARGDAPSRGPEVRREAEVGSSLDREDRPLDAPIACSEGVLVVARAERVTALGAEDLRTRWETGLDGPVIASPVVSGGRVFVGTSRGLTALRLADGAGEWTYAAAYGVGAAPLVTGGTIYACVGNEAVVALDPATGARRWERRCAAGRAAPALAGDRVIVGVRSSEVLALDPSTGAVAWRVPVAGGVSFAPAAVGGSVIVGDGARRIRCLDGRTGRTLWERSVEGRFAGDGPAVTARAIVFATDRMEIEAYDPATGSRLWRRWMGTTHLSSPAQAGAVTLFGARTRLHAVATESGDDLWRIDLDGEVASPVVSGGVVYALAGRRIVAVGGPRTGTPR